MRLGLALGENIDLATARRADELGFWALLARGDPGAEMVRAARLVAATRDLRVIVEVDLQAEHPMTIAEEAGK